MLVQSDFLLKHQLWFDADVKLLFPKIFTRMVDLFIVCCSIGINEDKIVENDESMKSYKQIGRNTYIGQNEDLYNIIHFLFQNAILNSKTVNFTNKQRLRLAFDPDYPSNRDGITFSPTTFLVKFANYGLTKIMECCDNQDTLFVDNIHEMINTYINGIDISEYIAENIEI